ncbi:MAG: hypothetical protein U9R17_08210 [Thermodesulfobacteriota bacterium]|nr:hypothetical protein [Thermodesulfobacteriota bacterium]
MIVKITHRKKKEENMHLQMAGLDIYRRPLATSKQNHSFIPGKSRINYAGPVYDEKEMINLLNNNQFPFSSFFHINIPPNI